MNTTFTTYAEKKAKQFLNLLHGYTNGIRTTAILILLLMGVNNAWATDYYYRGENNSWGATKMTVSDDGFYSYYDASWYTHQFKISTSESSWDYNYRYVQQSFNNTDVSCGDHNQDNCKAWHCKHFILVYHPNTTINNTNLPIICAATYLPDNSPEKTVYLKPNSNWQQQNARFAIHYWDNRGNNGWYSMLPVGCTNTPEYYSGVVPAGYSNIKFVRMDPANSTNNWDNHWNSTADLKKQGGELFTIPSGAWDNSTTTWSAYTAPTYAIDLNHTTGGIISISKTSPIEVGTEITVTMTPATGYKFKSGKITIGNNTPTNITEVTSRHTICGPTTITAEFEKETNLTLYLKPNSNWKQDDARFAMYYWEDGKSNGWVEMIAIGDCNNEYYKAELPAGYTDFKFVRLNPTNFQLSWDNKWNETGDLSKPNNGNNCFTINDDQWENGVWSEYSDEYSAQVQMGVAGGAISIDKKSYSTTSTLPNVKLGSIFTIDGITPNNNYKLKSCTVEMGDESYTPTTFPVEYKICGPITVTVEYASVYTVTFNKNGHGTAPDAQKVESGMTASEPSMQDADGYLFAGWYTTANCTTKFDFSTKINANKTLYAKWVAYENCVFFKNTLGWGNVYVYTFNEDVWKENGVRPNPNDGGKILEFAKMTQLGMSDIYYFVMTKEPNNYTQDNNSNKNYIAFSDIDMSTFYDFHETNAIYRGDHKKNLTLFIPQKDQTPEGINYANYYSKGIWMKYNSTESGYQLPGTIPNDDPDPNHDGWGTWGNKFESETKGGYTFSITKTLEANRDYEFKIKNYVWFTDWENNANNEWFGNDGEAITEDNCTGKHFHDENDKKHGCGNAKITTTEAGDYTFHIYLGDGKVILSVDYPVGKDSYRLAYKDNQKNFKPGHKILKSTKAEELDTVSFFVRRNESPCVKLQKFTSGKWSDVVGWQPVTVTADSVYNFVMKQTNQGASAELLMNQTHLYTGKYYIRTNSVDGSWVDFRRNDHEMTYTSYADKHEDFDHYFCKWIESGDLTYTVANDYSYCISDTLTDDSFTNNDGTLKAKASVRFGWDSQTNDLRRAYLSGSSHVADRFLVLIGKDDNLKDKAGNKLQIDGMNANETNFADLQNWIYQVDVKANKNTKVKLTAHYDGKIQYFAGKEEGANEYVQLISSDAEKTYPIRIIYDFKTNHLVAAWTMEGNQTITNDDILGTNMMIIRTDHEQAEQLTFNPAAKQMSQVDTVYAVMSFSESFIKDDSKSINERAFYWVSFPFDVQISDVFGFGEYAEHWIMQEYDGESRAKYGLFEDSGTYWKYIYDTKTVLTSGKGYVLTLDVDKVKNSFVHNINKVSLYFPSKGNIGTITGEVPIDMEVPHHLCTINMPDATPENRRDRRIYDSHWNIIGVPAFADVSQFETSSDNAPLRYSVDSLSFYYEYVPAKDNYRTRLAGENKTDGTHAGSHKRTFQAMYGYMVQFAGHLNWSAKSPVIPDQLAARRNSESELPEKVVLGLELVQGEEKADQTFVQLQQEGASAEFDMNLDLTKIINSGANIYTLTNDRIQAAGNALPMEKAIVPVGVQIAAEGEYTFRMPDGTEGMVVELIDYETNTRTNLLLSDYIVTLPKGTSENRFALHIQPQKDVVTSLENIGEGVNNGEAVNKYLIDGKLIIRTAEGIFDAQGHRL